MRTRWKTAVGVTIAALGLALLWRPPAPAPPSAATPDAGSSQRSAVIRHLARALLQAKPLPADAGTAARRPGGTATIEVVVTGPGGEPIEDAAVGVTRPGMEDHWDRTDAQGRASLAKLSAGDYELSVGADGYQDVTRRIALLSGRDERLVIPLAAGAALAGQVLDAQGSPVVGAWVTVQSLDGLSGHVSGSTGGGGGEGRFHYEGLEPGPHVLRVRAKGRPPLELRAVAPNRNVEIRYAPGATLHIRITPPEGLPVHSPSLWVEGPAPGVLDPVELAPGDYELQGLAAGEYVVRARSDACGLAEGAPFAMETVLVPGTGSQTVEIELPVTRCLTGIIVDPSGMPVPGAKVRAHGDKKHSHGFDALVATSHVDGRFRLPAAPTGRRELRVEKPGFRPTLIWANAEEGPTLPPVVLEPAPRVTGRVLDPEGQPVPSFQINGTSLSAADGRFSLPLGPDGGTELRVEADGYAMAERDVDPDVPTELGDIRLSPHVLLTGRVLDAKSGAPVGQASLWMVDGLKHRRSAVAHSAPDGRFELWGTPGPSEASIWAEADGYLGTTVARPDDPASVEIRLRSLAFIEGRVQCPDGGIDDRAWAWIVRSDTRSGTGSRLHPDGTFRSGGLAAGEYEVAASCLDGQHPSAVVTVHLGEVKQVVLQEK